MRLSEKALLLNALLLPGLGHVVLKRYILGSVFVILSLLCLVLIVWQVFRFTQLIFIGMNTAMEQGQTTSLMGVFGQSVQDFNFHSIIIAFGVLMMVWIVAIVDIYRITKLA